MAIDWLARTPELRHRRVQGTAVFADISGFTKLTERLAVRGRAGAEEMGDLLNSVFEPLLSAAYDYGATLVKWGGDAVLLLFDGPGHALRGPRAAYEMQQVMRRIGRIETTPRCRAPGHVDRGAHRRDPLPARRPPAPRTDRHRPGGDADRAHGEGRRPRPGGDQSRRWPRHSRPAATEPRSVRTGGCCARPARGRATAQPGPEVPRHRHRRTVLRHPARPSAPVRTVPAVATDRPTSTSTGPSPSASSSSPARTTCSPPTAPTRSSARSTNCPRQRPGRRGRQRGHHPGQRRRRERRQDHPDRGGAALATGDDESPGAGGRTASGPPRRPVSCCGAASPAATRSPVTTARPIAGRYSIAGDMVNLAARLMSRAGPGQVPGHATGRRPFAHAPTRRRSSSRSRSRASSSPCAPCWWASVAAGTSRSPPPGACRWSAATSS